VDPVDGIADVLEHALEGHEEVSILEAPLTAEREEGRDTHRRTAVGDATTLQSGQTFRFFCVVFFLFFFLFFFKRDILFLFVCFLNGIAFRCW